jgi:hypothetical protein
LWRAGQQTAIVDCRRAEEEWRSLEEIRETAEREMQESDQTPDPFPYADVYLYLFFGPTSTIQSIDVSMAAMDTRLPRHRHQCR